MTRGGVGGGGGGEKKKVIPIKVKGEGKEGSLGPIQKQGKKLNWTADVDARPCKGKKKIKEKPISNREEEAA